VRISGIKVGKVLAQRLDPVSFRAEVTFSVKDGIEVPSDSSAAIVRSGLLGGKYLSLVPGGDDRLLKDGEELTLTQSAVNLEDLIGRYIFSQGQTAAGQQGGQQGGQQPGGAAPAPPGGALQ
jgi:phospholipid/cholesterol/gamma-HCH transport system substrate-binding protein